MGVRWVVGGHVKMLHKMGGRCGVVKESAKYSPKTNSIASPDQSLSFNNKYNKMHD